MAKSRINQARVDLERFLTYMLLARPDEFGLAPEGRGYFLKDVLKALAEEGRPVRESAVRELNTLAAAEGRDQPFLIEENILVPTQGPLPQASPADETPPLLFGFCRRKAHAHTLERGLGPGRSGWVVLARTRELAARIGARSDREPVLITVEAERAMAQGVYFAALGEHLFLTNELPPHLLQMPPPPKERPEKAGPKQEKSKEPRPFMPSLERMPGSVELSLGQDPELKAAEQRGRKKSKKEWQKDRRSHRREKDKW